MLVLSVQVDMSGTQIAERRGRRQRIVDERAASSVSRELTANDHFGAVGAFEDGLNRGELFAGAHQIGARPAAKEQVDGLHQNRFAGARFTGEYVEAGPELYFDLVDDGESANGEEAKHVKPGSLMLSNL